MSKLRKIKRIGSYHQLLLFCILFILYFNNVNTRSGRNSYRSRSQCDDPESLRNGAWRRRNKLLIYSCRRGFTLFGVKHIHCINGKWRGDRPVCAKSGCTADPYYNVRYGRFFFQDTSIKVTCSEGYEPVGNSLAYCNGTTWDRPLGYCREYSGKVRHGCDFETSSICGWVAEYSEGIKWRRAMAENLVSSFRTGPHHDHTTMTANGGHYMLMESFGQSKEPAVLNSPIYGREISLKTACCFQFYYFMYGAGVGNLNVYVKPVSKLLKDVVAKKENYVKFSMSGHQNSNWNEAHFSIEEMDDDFQIVFVADGAQSHLGDIAIDDVKMMTGTECKSLDRNTTEPDDSAEYETTTTDNSLIYDTGSCVNRCFMQSNTGIIRETDNSLRLLCSCDEKCTEANTCCPDYIQVCLDAPDDDAFFYTNIPPSLGSTLTTTTPTTTTSKTTTTTRSLPSNTTTTTTTTTTKTPPVTIPSTRSSTTTTTTTTTCKPTTKKGTTTTTTSTTVKTTIPTSTSTISTTNTTPKQRATTNTTTTAVAARKLTTPTTRISTTTIISRTRPTTTSTKATTTSTKATTTSTKATTTSTKATTTSTKATTTNATVIMKTTTNTKRSSTSTTTVGPTKIPVNTEPIFKLTTGSAIERGTVTSDAMPLPQKAKIQHQKNITKSTWEWQPKPDSNPRATLALACVCGLLLTIIIVGSAYRQRATIKRICFKKILKKTHNDDGAEDSCSIVANFRKENPTQNGNSAANGNTKENRLKLTLPSIRIARQEKRNSAEEEDLYCDNDNDDIPLL